MPELSTWRHIFSSAGFEEPDPNASQRCRNPGCENCFCAVCFPACQYGKISEKFDFGEKWQAQEPECAAVTYTCLSPLGIFSSWLPWMWPLNYNSRKAMKDLIHMKETDCETFLIAAFCSPCSNAQVLREVSRLRPSSNASDPFAATQMGAPRRQRMKTQLGASCKSTYCS